MKLTQVDIQNIDSWLKNRGFKYIDVRYELLDHLVSEYEQIENYPDLESFLKERLTWCKKVEKQKQKTINFGMSKALFKKFFSLFTNIKSLFILLLTVFILFVVESIVVDKIFRIVLMTLYFLIVGYHLYLMIFSGFGSRLKKEALSVVYLLNIFSLPWLPLYFMSLLKDQLKQQIFYIPYLTFAILMGISAILVFHEKRKILLKEFDLLKEQYA